MKKERYVAILKNLRGYEVAGRSGDADADGTWIQKKNRLRKLDELEKLVFEPTLEIIMKKKCGEIVLDDEPKFEEASITGNSSYARSC